MCLPSNKQSWRDVSSLGTRQNTTAEVEEAYRYDETAARYPLIRALLAQGEDVDKAGQEDDALRTYERVLAISSREAVAREKVERIQAVRRKRDLEASAAEVATLIQSEAWDSAAEVYRQLLALDPQDNRWPDGLAQMEKERSLARRYAEGIGALQQSQWSEAQRAFADVVYERPVYKQAAELLVSAIRQDSAAPVSSATDFSNPNTQ